MLNSLPMLTDQFRDINLILLIISVTVIPPHLMIQDKNLKQNKRKQ